MCPIPEVLVEVVTAEDRRWRHVSTHCSVALLLRCWSLTLDAHCTDVCRLFGKALCFRDMGGQLQGGLSSLVHVSDIHVNNSGGVRGARPIGDFHF